MLRIRLLSEIVLPAGAGRGAGEDGDGAADVRLVGAPVPREEEPADWEEAAAESMGCG